MDKYKDITLQDLKEALALAKVWQLTDKEIDEIKTEISKRMREAGNK
jgi:hypothetical protein